MKFETFKDALLKETVLIRLTEEEFETLKNALITGDSISRSEFLSKLQWAGLNESVLMVIDNIEDLRFANELPRQFIHKGFTYNDGCSSASGLSAYFANRHEAYIVYSCYDKEVPNEIRSITVSFKPVGTSLIIDKIEYKDR